MIDEKVLKYASMEDVLHYNYATWYILPMLNLNLTSFGLIDDSKDLLGKKPIYKLNYITTKCKINIPFRIHVVVESLDVCKNLLDHDYYLSHYQEFDKTVLLFAVPAEYYGELSYFSESNFTKFSEAYKRQIVYCSGLKKFKLNHTSNLLFGLYGKYLKNKDLNPLYIERQKDLGLDIVLKSEDCLLSKIVLEKELIY